MAGITQHWRIFKLVVDMAFIAFHIIMLAAQLELGFVVIKTANRFPIFFDVTFRTIGA
jgi:hypothetical protein